MDRLVRLRQRAARRGSQQGAAVASLPAEVLGSIIERACASDYRRVASLRELTKFGCVSKAFLEALKYVGALELNILANRSSRSCISTDAGAQLTAVDDIHVQRWCDIARRRLRHVRRIHDKGGTGVFFSPRQTQMLVDCFASFPGLVGLRFCDPEPFTACASMAAEVSAGRFGSLRHLVLHSRWTSMGYPEGLTPEQEYHVNFRQRIKLCYRDLIISQLPPDLGMDLFLDGAYPRLLEKDGDWDVWASVLSDLLSRGPDLHSRRILDELLDRQDFAHERIPAKENAFYNAFETLLVVHGVDPDCLVEKREFLYQEMRFPHRPLDRMLEELSSCIKRLDGDYYYIDPQPESEPTIRFVMRTIDLFVRHGATSTREDFPDGEEDVFVEDTDVRDFILERTDCTPRVREAINRGELYYWQHVSSM